MYGFGYSSISTSTPPALGTYSFNQTKANTFSVNFPLDPTIYPVFTSQPLIFNSSRTRCNISFVFASSQTFVLDYFELQFDTPVPTSSHEPSDLATTPATSTEPTPSAPTTSTGSTTSPFKSKPSFRSKIIGAGVAGTLVVVLLLLLGFMRRRKVHRGGAQNCTSQDDFAVVYEVNQYAFYS